MLRTRSCKQGDKKSQAICYMMVYDVIRIRRIHLIIIVLNNNMHGIVFDTVQYFRPSNGGFPPNYETDIVKENFESIVEEEKIYRTVTTYHTTFAIKNNNFNCNVYCQ